MNPKNRIPFVLAVVALLALSVSAFAQLGLGGRTQWQYATMEKVAGSDSRYQYAFYVYGAQSGITGTNVSFYPALADFLGYDYEANSEMLPAGSAHALDILGSAGWEVIQFTGTRTTGPFYALLKRPAR